MGGDLISRHAKCTENFEILNIFITQIVAISARHCCLGVGGSPKSGGIFDHGKVAYLAEIDPCHSSSPQQQPKCHLEVAMFFF